MKQLIVALKALIFLTLLLGVMYPLAVTLPAQILFSHQANGSLIMKQGQPIGSELIGQSFSSPRHFSSRPSSGNYDAMSSGGTNYSLTQKKLVDLVQQRADSLRKSNFLDLNTPLPADLLFSSASGLDPDISLEAAILQIERIAKIRKFTPDQKSQLLDRINRYTSQRQFYLLGEPHVNVLLLNLSIDSIR